MSDLRGHSMYIATRRSRLEAREAGFLVNRKAIGYYDFVQIELKAKYNFLSLENPLYLRNALTCYPACSFRNYNKSPLLLPLLHSIYGHLLHEIQSQVYVI